MRLFPVPRDVDAAAYPDAVMSGDVVQKLLQRHDAPWPSEQAAVHAHAHHRGALVALGVQWRRLLTRTSILARGGGDEAGKVKFRAYLGVLGARLLDGVDGAWRLQLDVLATLGVMQARGHLDPNPRDGDGVQLRPAAGLALAMGIVHGAERTRVGFRWEFGYLQGMAVNQGGRRVGTLTGWNVAFFLTVGFRVDET